jgi:hypothetical protein
MASFCAHCGAPLGDQVNFCHRCGTPRAGAANPADRRLVAANTILPWSVAGIALLCLLAFIVGQNWRRARPAPAAVTAQAAGTGAGGRAPDISQLSPDQRADMLFNRVMTYVGEGKSDSVMFFAPMAIGAFAALEPLNAHRRYDLGLIGVVSGDGLMARAQADTILRAAPSHLLGLILGMRAAGLQLDTLARRDFAARFAAALPAERAKRLPEYIDHEADIDAAATAAAREPRP